MSHDKDKDCKCHDCCSRVNQGVQGQRGPAGPRGQSGRDGKDGLDGLEGPEGPMGPQGIPGTCIPCNGDHPQPPENKCCQPEFGEAYSIMPQDLAASPGLNQSGGVVKLENIVYSTPNVDFSQAGTTGKVYFKKSGWWDIYTGMCGALNPVQSPLHVWTLSLFKNGTIVPGSTFANMTLSPEQKSNEIVADVFVHINAGDYLELANTSINLINLTAPVLGTNAQTNSAYMKAILLKEDSSTGNPLVDTANTSFINALNEANLSVIAGNAVNLSQLPADALLAQTAANNALTAANNANAALIAASGVSTPASVAAATTASANLQTASNAALVAANNVVSTLNPANTAILVSANATAASMAALLAAAQLVPL